MDRTQYGLYYVNVDTDERHHLQKGWHPADIKALARKALWIVGDFKKKEGSQYRLHGRWATGMEIWEFPFGNHEEFEEPDRRLAHIAWGNSDFTIEPGVDFYETNFTRAEWAALTPAQREKYVREMVADYIATGDFSVVWTEET